MEFHFPVDDVKFVIQLGAIQQELGAIEFCSCESALTGKNKPRIGQEEAKIYILAFGEYIALYI